MIKSYMSSVLFIIISAMIAMAFFTLLERKFMGYIHIRKGPNKIGFMGVLQPLADALKLFTKNITFPFNSSKTPFLMAPSISLILAMSVWALLPSQNNSMILKYSLIIFLILSSITVYTTLISGWISNSKYSLIGALRGAAQTISYEVSMAFLIISPIMMMKSFSLIKMNHFSIVFIVMIPTLMMWFTTLLAETNRSPFDMPEGESELVSGFNTEYGFSVFAMIFMSEYMSIMGVSMITTYLFLNYSSMNLILNNFMPIILITLLSIIFIVTRCTLPRLRYDQLMKLTWKCFLPLSMNFLLFLYYISMGLLFVSFNEALNF